MSQLIKLPTFKDSRGDLTVIEKILPFEIKRVYFIYNCPEIKRGGHRHIKTIQALICLKGSCTIDCTNNKNKITYILNEPDILLLLMPEDYHTMYGFSEDAILLVLASEYYNSDDYIHENAYD